MSSTSALWLAVVALGLYHGLNPAMGWPLAVANGLAQRRSRAVFATLLPLGGGHLAAMSAALLPFAWLVGYVSWSRAIQLAAGGLVLLFGVYRLLRRRHPRALARIRPTQLAWWSFWMATAHGAGLMLLPFTLGLCRSPPEAGGGSAAHAAVMGAMGTSNVITALSVAAVHTAAMLLAGLCIAWAVYRYLGLKFLSRVWLNLDAAWAGSLVLAGAAGVVSAA
ncbi:hypothetical protein PE066_04790 [Ramlibacter tataouinensis]|uniref:hypothetical protein n=1 Tax=Ramlibacter tataouinensis TaxID=94132 RepID=UPI0022F3BD50|nr:hypothetical protein [Ramlibacter tataouinensis]WBY02860.1 hypothetical protein PE066_04790 [Ramlibacter tataouinensis]